MSSTEQAYLTELKQLARVLLDATTRAEALNEEEKPASLVRSLNLGEMVEGIHDAWREVDTVVKQAELLLAAEGLKLED